MRCEEGKCDMQDMVGSRMRGQVRVAHDDCVATGRVGIGGRVWHAAHAAVADPRVGHGRRLHSTVVGRMTGA